MSDTEYLVARAEQELHAAVGASAERARAIHLQLADAYSFRVREIRALERRAELHLAEVKPHLGEVISMRRDQSGKCPENPSRNHAWIDVTTKEDNGRNHYICRDCRKEALE